jgi:hypothetical protein
MNNILEHWFLILQQRFHPLGGQAMKYESAKAVIFELGSPHYVNSC